MELPTDPLSPTRITVRCNNGVWRPSKTVGLLSPNPGQRECSEGNRGLEAPYAIMVYVHGESYEWNAGNPYDGSVLASFGHVIVVTINFRLGILDIKAIYVSSWLKMSFLRTNSKPGTLGNFGLRDLMAALNWVKENIAAFGGDPMRVTLFGHDTGAALVNLLLISTAARGLFHRVVLLSGSALSPWALVRQPTNLRSKVADQLGCLGNGNTSSEPKAEDGKELAKTDDEEDIAPCLRKKTLKSLMDVQIETPRFLSRFGPFLDGSDLDMEPANAMEKFSETFITSELMFGATTTESYQDFNAQDIQYGFEEDERNRILRTYIRNTYVYHLNEIFSTVRNEYTDWDKPIQHPINIRDSTMEALSDAHTVSPLVKVGYLHSRRGAKTYFFHFGYQTKDSDYPQRLGSVRGEDVTYVMGLPLVGGQPFFPQNYSKQDMGIAEAMLIYFTNFAKTGDPNEPRNQKSDYGTVKEKTRYHRLSWDPYEITTQLYLNIALKPKMKNHYRGHKMAVWLNLIPQLHQPGDDDVSMRHHHFHERGEHYYAGVVRPEPYTRLPPPLYPATSATNVPTSGASGSRDAMSPSTECIPSSSADLDDDAEDSDEAGLLQRLATRHYYSYTTALGVTVGVGCLLLVLNMLIFAGIYYQRDRRRYVRKERPDVGRKGSGSVGSLAEGIPLTHCPMPSEVKVQPKAPGRRGGGCSGGARSVHEPPPSYTSVSKSPSIPEPPPPPRQTASGYHGNTTPTRRSANSSGTVKKRVQIQEISV